jgi:RHS repeat-associated protein
VTLYVGELQELQVAGGQVLTRTSYYYHGGVRVGMRVAGVVYYLHADHLGSVTLTTDEDGDVVARRLYRPYGATRYTWGALLTEYGYTGQHAEVGFGLVYIDARWYHSALKRWLSADALVPDPANPQSLNRYSYVLGNPLRYVDPSGHQPTLPDDDWIREVAETFQIPAELLGAVLQTIVEIDYDAVDFTEDAAVAFSLSFCTVPTILLVASLPDRLSTGLAQMQYRTAERVAKWLEESSDDPDYAAMLEMLSPADDRSSLAGQLLEPEQATVYAAAYLRQITEYQFGRQVDVAAMNDEDMALVAALYNGGIEGDADIEVYSDNKFGKHVADNALLDAWRRRLSPTQNHPMDPRRPRIQ